METRNEKAKRIVAEMMDLAIMNGEPNFSISVSGDKSTIESEQGEAIAQRAEIKAIHLYVNLEDCEDD